MTEEEKESRERQARILEALKEGYISMAYAKRLEPELERFE